MVVEAMNTLTSVLASIEGNDSPETGPA